MLLLLCSLGSVTLSKHYIDCKLSSFYLLSISQKDNVKVFVLLFGDMSVGGKKPVDVASEYAASELKHKNITVCPI